MAKDKISRSISDIFSFLHNNVSAVNNSKFFAGLMIIVLNISSRFVNIKLSKTMESYLKYTFSRDILVFAISWMGTRDIYVAFIITFIFILAFDFLLNENSTFCCLPEQFTDYHVSLLDNNDKVSEDDIKKATETLEKAKKQKSSEQNGQVTTQTPNRPVQYQNYSASF